MLFEYKVGMCVKSKEDLDDPSIGVITKVINNHELMVLWDDYDNEIHTYSEDILPSSEEDLKLVADINKKTQYKIDEATSLLEQSFKALYAARLIQEGLKEDEECRYISMFSLSQNEDLDFSKFESVVEKFGWNTSSLYC